METTKVKRIYLAYADGLLIGAMTEEEAYADILSRRPVTPPVTTDPVVVKPVVVAPSKRLEKGEDIPAQTGKLGTEFEFVIPENAFRGRYTKMDVSDLPGMNWHGLPSRLIKGRINRSGSFTIKVNAENEETKEKAQSSFSLIVPGPLSPAPNLPTVPPIDRPDAATPQPVSSEGDQSGETDIKITNHLTA